MKNRIDRWEITCKRWYETWFLEGDDEIVTEKAIEEKREKEEGMKNIWEQMKRGINKTLVMPPPDPYT